MPLDVLRASQGTLTRLWRSIDAEIRKRERCEAHSTGRRRAAKMAAASGAELSRPPRRMYSYGFVPPKIERKGASFVELLQKYIREKCDGKASLAYKAARIDRASYSMMISNWRKGRGVLKRTAVAYAFALRLDLDQAIELISAAGYSLTNWIDEDLVFMQCFKMGMLHPDDVNLALAHYNCSPLFKA